MSTLTLTTLKQHSLKKIDPDADPDPDTDPDALQANLLRIRILHVYSFDNLSHIDHFS